MELLTTAVCRELYQQNVAISETLLNSYRNPDIELTPEMKQVRWVLVSDIVKYKGRTHYNRKQVTGKSVNKREREWYEVQTRTAEQEAHQATHHDRMLMLIDFIREHQHESIGWCVSSFKLRFGELDTKRQMSDKGVGYSNDYRYSGPLDDVLPMIEYGNWLTPQMPIERPGQIVFTQHVQKMRRGLAQLGLTLTENEFIQVLIDVDEVIHKRPLTDKYKTKFIKRYVDFLHIESIVGAGSLESILHV